MPEIDLVTVILAVIALFVAFKLRSVLGTRADDNRPPGMIAPLRRAPGPVAAAPADAAAIAAPPAAAPADRWKGSADPEAWSGLDAVAQADPSFAAPAFLAGARSAYEMIVHAFAAGDSATLRGLLSPEAFGNFDNAVQARAAAGQTMTTTVIAIDEAKIVGAQFAGAMEQIVVRFVAKLNSATRDKAGEVVEGSATEVADHIDLWTFVRDVRSRDPNWQLQATQAEH
jgi:predicted lipid-binding transport protein (Tim44 family)